MAPPPSPPTSPYLTLPHPTSPYLTLPHPTSPYLTLPHPTSPYLTLPHPTSPYLCDLFKRAQIGYTALNLRPQLLHPFLVTCNVSIRLPVEPPPQPPSMEAIDLCFPCSFSAVWVKRTEKKKLSCRSQPDLNPQQLASALSIEPREL